MKIIKFKDNLNSKIELVILESVKRTHETLCQPPNDNNNNKNDNKNNNS